MTEKQLCDMAVAMLERSYVPYSHFPVGAALLKLGVIAGEASEYGLYVKPVNGATADYDADGTYWGLYINGEYAMTGVDATTLEAGATYAFRVEKVEG